MALFPNDPSQQQQQQQQSQSRTYLDPWNPNLFSASSGLENRSGGGEYDYQMQAFTFGSTPGGSSTSEKRFLSRFALEATIELRGYQIHYSGNNNGNKMGYHHQQSHSIGGTTASSNLFPPPTVDFHSGQQRKFLLFSKVLPSASQLRNLCLLSAAGSASNPNLPSDNHRSFSPGMGHFCRASSGTRSDCGGNCVILWGRREGESLS